MRRTRIRGILIGALILVIGVAIALVVRNYVAADDGEEPVCSVSISATKLETYPFGYLIKLDSTEGVKTIQGSITYDTEKFVYTRAASMGEVNEHDGTVTFILSAGDDGADDGNYGVFFMDKKTGATGSGLVTLSIDQVNYQSEDGEVPLSGDNVGGNRSISIEIPDPEPGPGPENPDPTVTPSEWTLNSTINAARLMCLHRGYDIESCSSSDEGLVSAVVDGDYIRVSTTAERDGDAIVTVNFSEGKTATATIHVKADQEPDVPVDPDDPVNPDDFPDIPVVEGSPVVTPSGNQSMIIGGILQMSVDQAGVTWTSSDTSVAIVDSSTGLISAVGKGAAIISVKNNTGKSTNFYVIVNEKDSENGSNSNNNSNSNNSSTNTTTNNIKNGTTSEGKENPTADDPVPQTGESTVEYVVIIGIITLVVASVIFKVKSRRNG